MRVILNKRKISKRICQNLQVITRTHYNKIVEKRIVYSYHFFVHILHIYGISYFLLLWIVQNWNSFLQKYQATFVEDDTYSASTQMKFRFTLEKFSYTLIFSLCFYFNTFSCLTVMMHKCKNMCTKWIIRTYFLVTIFKCCFWINKFNNLFPLAYKN